ncbi:hypothetical protein [Kocuria rosea]|jgi:hypothetical protein|uniref:hypothetical protein n=1 Tax=Kocuria rosea TaxID=1275 RepID=UPI00203C52DB|nr:hypothetical protein [Kocuria rosea]MCM3689064.1 hypothetical protein [Kocuria rosea]
MSVSRGMGGGGAMYDPVISPWPAGTHWSEAIFVGCDMSGLYRSLDGGKHWTMLDYRDVQCSAPVLASTGRTTAFSVALDPATPGRVAAWHPHHGFRLSVDGGMSWPVQLPHLIGHSAGSVGPFPTCGAFTGEGRFLLIGTGQNLQRIDTLSPSSGWVTVTTVPQNEVVALACPYQQPTWCLAATPAGVYWSVDGGQTFSPLAPLVGVVDIACASSSPGAAVVYAVVTTPGGSGARMCDLTTSTMPGSPPSWADISVPPATSAPNITNPAPLQYRFVSVAESAPEQPYVAAFNPIDVTTVPYWSVFKGTRSGTQVTWIGVYDGFQTHASRNVEPGWVEPRPPVGRDWGFGGAANGFAVDPRNSQQAVVTNMATTARTTDGGKPANNASWGQCYTQAMTAAGRPSWDTTGLDVTTVWHYDELPSDPQNVHFIAATDVGLLRSSDGGGSFELACFADLVTDPVTGQVIGGALWGNCYELAFKPSTDPAKATVFAAVSNRHDLPFYRELRVPVGASSKRHGAVLRSDNGGQSWRTIAGATSADWGKTFTNVGGAHPLPEGPVVSVLLDGGVLYAAVWEKGVYWSSDEGTEWYRVGSFPSQPSPHCHRLQAHAGHLYCVTAAVNTGTAGAPAYVSGGLWQMPAAQLGAAGTADVTANWVDVTATLPLAPGKYRSMTDFAVDPADSQIIFVCSEPNGASGQGGLFWTRDGGGTWQTTASGGHDFLPGPNEVTLHYPWVAPFAPTIIGDRLFLTTTTTGTFSSPYPTTPAGWATWRPRWAEYQAAPFRAFVRIEGSIDATAQRSDLYLCTYGGSVWPVHRRWSWVLDHATITRPEVQTDPVVRAVAYLVLEGFTGPEMGITGPSTLPAVTCSEPGVTAALADLQQETPDLAVPQRLTMRCDLTFDQAALGSLFPASAADPPRPLTLTFSSGPFTCTARITLVFPARPFILDGPIPYLSQGLRAFRVRAGTAPYGGVTLPVNATPADARQYLEDLLTALNGPGGEAIFETSIPTGWPAGSSLQIAETENGDPVYNFAVARVNYTGSTVLPDVRVFFRLFSWGVAAVDYDPNGAYAYAPPTAPGAPPEPLIPLIGTRTGTVGTREVVTVPCFATQRVDVRATAMADQTDATNVHTFAAGEPVHFFGCLLDINQPGSAVLPTEKMLGTDRDGPWPLDPHAPDVLVPVQRYVLGRHQCLIADLHAWTGAPDPLAPGDVPGTSNYLAQRNLFIIGSDNPGNQASHTITHPFSIRALRTYGQEEGRRDAVNDEAPVPSPAADELWLWLTDLPEGTTATLFCPDLDAEEIVRLAAERTGPTTLYPTGPHTLTVPAGTLVTVALPPLQDDAPALLTLELPPERVGRGERFDVQVQQRGGAENAILGGFTITIPVQDAAELLPDEATWLAVLRQHHEAMVPEDRRHPVITRYLDHQARKVEALSRQHHGDPSTPPEASETER